MTIFSQGNTFENVFAKWRTFCLGLSQCVNHDVYYNDDHQLRGSIYVFDEKCDIQRIPWSKVLLHYNDGIVDAIAFQINSLTTVYSTVYSDADQRKHQSSASLAFVRGIHRGLVNSPHKWPVTRKMSPFDDVIMIICCELYHSEWVKGLLWHPRWCECSIIHCAHIYIYIHIMKKCV